MHNEGDKLLAAATDFLVPLRLGDGYDEERFEGLCRSLRDFLQVYANRDSVPKSSVSIFVDLFPCIEACSTLYHDTERQNVLDAASKIYEIISEGL